jgi:hypothetical protein
VCSPYDREGSQSVHTRVWRVVGAGLIVGSLGIVGCGKEPAPISLGPRTSEITGATASGAVRSRDTTDPAGDAAFVVKLVRAECYGLCPAYSVELRADGTVEYAGRAYVRDKGPKTSHIDAAAVASLAKRIEDAGFLAMTWKDPCDAVATDNPTATITLVRGDRKRTIENYHGNRCMPKVLRELEDEIDRVAGTAAWTKCAGYCQR